MMNFNQHYKQRGLHAVFSPSQCSWLRYDDEKALNVYVNKQASERGSRLHAWAFMRGTLIFNKLVLLFSFIF